MKTMTAALAAALAAGAMQAAAANWDGSVPSERSEEKAKLVLVLDEENPIPLPAGKPTGPVQQAKKKKPKIAVIQITHENYDAEVKNSKLPVVLDFYADWCDPCKYLAPIIEELAKSYRGKVKFGKVDTDAQANLVKDFNVTTIPTIVFIKKGAEVSGSRLTGAIGTRDKDKKRIDDAIKKHLLKPPKSSSNC